VTFQRQPFECPSKCLYRSWFIRAPCFNLVPARRVLRISVFAFTVLLLGMVAGALYWQQIIPASKPFFRFVHITDLHLPDEAPDQSQGSEIQSFRAAVEEINALEPPPEFVVVTGDIARHNGEPGAYQLFKQISSGLKIPVYVVPGNHDRRAIFRKYLLEEEHAVDAPVYFAFGRDSYRFIFLDSSQPGDLYGYLDKRQLNWLKQEWV